MFSKKVKKDAFCMNLILYDKKEAKRNFSSEPQAVPSSEKIPDSSTSCKFHRVIDSINQHLKDLTEGQKLEYGHSSLVIFTKNIPVPLDQTCETQFSSPLDLKNADEKASEGTNLEEFLYLEVFPRTSDSVIVNISWLTPNSYMVHYVKFLIYKAAEKEKMDITTLNFSLNKFFEIATLEPCYIVNELSKE